MGKVGRKRVSIRCRCTRNTSNKTFSRIHKDSKGKYLICGECGRRHYNVEEV